MPAKSKAQQRFMGIVHAAQKGDMPNASSAVKKAAASMSKKSAKDYASTPTKGLPDKVKETMHSDNHMNVISKFNEYGRALKRETKLSELAKRLSGIAELAETTALSEQDDWYDEYTVKRNMKEIRKYAEEFEKYAREADKIHERVTALYDDMGNVLERYFEIHDTPSEDEAPVEAPMEENKAWRADMMTPTKVPPVGKVKRGITEKWVKETVSRMVREETEYQKFFNATLKKFGVNSPDELKSDEHKKKFFNYVDKHYSAKNESKVEKKLREMVKSCVKEYADGLPKTPEASRLAKFEARTGRKF